MGKVSTQNCHTLQSGVGTCDHSKSETSYCEVGVLSPFPEGHKWPVMIIDTNGVAEMEPNPSAAKLLREG